MTTRSLTFTLDSLHNITNIQQVGIHDITVILSRSHKYQPTSFIIEPGLLLSKLLLLLLTHSVTNYELGPYPRAWLSIDLIEVAHCTHTTKPMASHSHSGGPTVFWQNWPIAMSLSRPVRPTPIWAKSWVTQPTKGETTTVVANKQSQTGTCAHNQTRVHKAYVRLPDQVSACHNLP